MDHHIFRAGTAPVRLFDFNGILLRLPAADRGADHRFSRMHILLQSQRHCLRRLPLRLQGAEYAASVVQIQTPHGFARGEAATQLPGGSGTAFGDALDVDAHHLAAGQGNDLPGIHVAHRMSQTGESAAVWHIIGHGADAGSAVPHPQPRLVTGIYLAVQGRQGQGADVASPVDPDLYWLTLCLPDGLLEGGVAVDGGIVHGQHHIPHLDPGTFRRTFSLRVHLTHAHHHDPVHQQLDAEGISPRHHQGRIHRCDLHGLDGQEPEQPQADAAPHGYGFCRIGRGVALRCGFNGQGGMECKLRSFCHIKAVRQGIVIVAGGACQRQRRSCSQGEQARK